MWGRTVVLAAAIAAAVSGGCGDDGGEVPELAHRAEEVRELQFDHVVEQVNLTQEEFEQMVADEVGQQTDADLRELADTYGRLGFFDVNLDLRPILTSSRVDATGAFYSFDTREITIIGDAEPATVVHEYVHALQDQNFDLAAYDLDTSDGFLAHRAVVEGDATLAEGRFEVEEQTNRRVGLEGIDLQSWIGNWVSFSEEFLDDSDYPIIFRAYASFAYAYGLRYSIENLLGVVASPAPPPPHDWTRQDALYTTRPPSTTEEVLGGSDPVVAVGIDDVPAALSSRLERLDWDSLGAWYSYLLVRPYTSSPIREQWDGDRALFARDRGTRAMGVLWASAWDTETVASQVAGVLHSIHDGAGEPLIIERRGTAVVMARNFAADVGPALVQAAFAGTSKPSPPRTRPALLARRREVYSNGCFTSGRAATAAVCAAHEPSTAWVPSSPPCVPMIHTSSAAMPAPR